MSAIRFQRAARALPSISSSLSRPALGPQRFASSKSAATTQDSRLVRQPESKQGLVEHPLDYDAHIDQATSTFSPVPRHVMDGSEPGETVAAAVLSGAPVDLQARTVRIYKPTKNAMQSGTWHQHHWRMDWDPLPKGHRWENPLMGWQSSADFMQGTNLNFKTKEDAILFAQKQGYEYFVQEPQVRKFKPKAYAEQFVHIPGKIKQVRTK